MLDIMRRKKRLKLVLWLVIISLGLGMLLLFVPGQNIDFGGFDTSAASVAGESISMKEFYDTYQRFRENYSDGGKNETDPQTMKRLGVDQQALNALIEVKIVGYAAKRLGLDVTPEEVREAIEANPNLRNESGFIGVDAYKAVLAANRIDLDQFEDGIRYMLLSDKITNLLTDSISIPEKQLRDAFARLNQEAKVQYAYFDKETFQKRINPTDAELQAYFEANKDKYAVKEERRAQYLLFSLSTIASTVPVSEREIDDEWTKLAPQETVDASHILFKVDDPAKDAEVKARAEEILKRAKSGEDFAALAKKYSEDEGSAAQGGNLGSFPRGTMDPAFEAAAFALKPGEISDLVRSSYGYHIIKVISHDIPSKESRRPSLIRSIQLDKASGIAKETAEEARKLAETQQDFNAIAKEMKVPVEVKETGFLNRSADAYAAGVSPEFVNELFNLKEINAIGQPVEVPTGYAVPKLMQVNPPKPPEFTTARESVRTDYVSEKATESMDAQAKQLSEEAKALGSLASAARKAGLTVKTTEPFKRDGSPAPELGSATDFTSAAFSLGVGEISGPIAMDGGKKAAVLQVESLTPFNEEEYAKQRPSLREGALTFAREAFFQQYIQEIRDSLQKAGKIRVNPQAFDAVNGYRD
jgi:peptidyl-prolyl cis-trans isomerase D